jgi:dienelactone hydrolase
MKSILSLMLMLFVSQTGAIAAPAREEVRFNSHGVALSGTLLIPAGDIHAVVVFVHGSGKQERNLHWAERFAAEGIAALVYDKRGAGKSGGEYEGNQSVSGKNVALLADDARAGVLHLTTHPGLKGKPIGLAGISQAGWIAPLAARNGQQVRFLVLWSGPVCKVSEEDIYSKHTGDSNQGAAPPYLDALKARTQEYVWPDFLGRDTDSAEDLAALSIPGLWIFSDNDPSIPVDLSIRQLQALRAQGHPYQYALFSGLGHDNMDRTFAMATDWIRRLRK